MLCRITSGVAFCGSVGSIVRSEYAIVGDSINLAARFITKTYADNLDAFFPRGRRNFHRKGVVVFAIGD